MTVASLVPAASDLILAMGAGEHLVAISNYDMKRPETEKLARVGDYQTIDWEKIAELRPGILIHQMETRRIPPGMTERAQGLGIRLVNVRIERLEDVFAVTGRIGEVIEEKDLRLLCLGTGQRNLLLFAPGELVDKFFCEGKNTRQLHRLLRNCKILIFRSTHKADLSVAAHEHRFFDTNG